MIAPENGTEIQIHSYKHDGHLHRIWKNNFILKKTESIVIGANDKTQVIESDGRAWITREPAIFYFHTDRSEEHTSELQSRGHVVCRLLLEKKKPSDID